MNRREFLAGLAAGTTAAAFAGPLLPRGRALAAPSGGRTLAVVNRTIEVNGRAARVFGLVGPDGKPGLTLKAGETFDVTLSNRLAEPALVHWHGLTPPFAQDGVPDNPLPQLQPAEERRYGFPVGDGGTFWMHAHTLQEQQLLAAPLIVRTAEDLARDEQEVVVLLHDFSFRTPEELLAGLQSAGGGGMAGMDSSGMEMGGSSGGMMHGGMHDMGSMSSMPMAGSTGPGGMAMDVNDIAYDAYLANDRTLDDPEIVQVDRGGRVRLRIINGATATAFTIDTDALEATLVAVDGQPVQPLAGRRFPVAMGQRLDLTLSLPADSTAWPILALREGAVERTGIILAPPGAAVTKLGGAGTEKGPLLDLALEQRLRPLRPLAMRSADRNFELTLTGTMAGYRWSIDGAGDGLAVGKGNRVEITMRNMSMMAHPMHLHGHYFAVVAIDGRRFPGAIRDTVLVPPMASVTIAFDAENPGHWPLHCHHLYHMATGMMTHVAYQG